MKHFATIAAIVIASICVTTHSIPAYPATQQIISLLNSTPNQNITGCTPQDLMNLLTDTSKEWVESIECYNVNIEKGKAGVTLQGTAGTEAYIKFNLKSDKFMQMINIRAYCEDTDDNKVDIIIDCNGNNILDKKVSLKSNFDSNSAQLINESIQNGSGNYLPTFIIPSSRFNPAIPVKSLKIYIPSSTNESFRIKFYAFAIYYDSIEEAEEEIITSVDEVQQDTQSPKEYYDLMGRKLSAEPQNGFYILKTGSKVEKRIAK